MTKHYLNEQEKQEVMKHVIAQRTSGLSQAKYCKQHGIHTSTFGRYKYKMESEKKLTGVSKTSGFIAVNVSGEVVYDVVIGKAVIKVPDAYIVEFIKKVSAE